MNQFAQISLTDESIIFDVKNLIALIGCNFAWVLLYWPNCAIKYCRLCGNCNQRKSTRNPTAVFRRHVWCAINALQYIAWFGVRPFIILFFVVLALNQYWHLSWVSLLHTRLLISSAGLGLAFSSRLDQHVQAYPCQTGDKFFIRFVIHSPHFLRLSYFVK